jgi:hypothetical protein
MSIGPSATGKITALLMFVDENLVQYEWVEQEQQWIKFFEDDPDPPDDLPPGKFDGQIIDVEKNADS